MKLKIFSSLSIEMVKEIYKDQEVIITEFPNGISIEKECSLQEAVFLIGLDQSCSDRSVELFS